MKFTRRDTLILAATASALSLCGVASANAAEGDMIDVAKLMAPAGGYVDHVLGSETAPVTIIEYASPTCPHCADFHNSVYPGLKADYIDTGKVRFILRPFLRGEPATPLDAAVFMLADAAGPANFHALISAFFKSQVTWSTSPTPSDAIFQVTKEFGFTEETFSAALTNQDLFIAMSAVRDQALNEFGLQGTPTFYVNGKTLTGDKTLEQLAAEIDPLVPADFVATTPAAPAAPAATPAAPAAPATPATPETAAPAGGAMAPAAPTATPVTPAPAAPAAQ